MDDSQDYHRNEECTKGRTTHSQVGPHTQPIECNHFQSRLEQISNQSLECVFSPFQG